MRKNKGMTTIEACVIIPITFTIIMLLLWLGFLFYNKSVLSEAASRAAIVGGEHSDESNESIADRVNEKMAEYVEGRLIFIDTPQVNITVDYTTVTVNVTAVMNLPESIFFGNLYENRLWSIDITKSSPRLKPCRFIRAVDGLLADE